MSRNSDYKNLKELTSSLSRGINKLESGNLNPKELTALLDDSRTLHERITILQYLAFDKEVKGKEVKRVKKEFKTPQGNFELNFGTPETNDDHVVEANESESEEVIDEIHPNQTNLLDAIEEHVDEVFEPEAESKEEKGSLESKIDSVDNSSSINDKFADDGSGNTLADKLGRQPIEDLKSAIGLNQKFLFMNDLFEGENEIFQTNYSIDKECFMGEVIEMFSNNGSKYSYDQNDRFVYESNEIQDE